MVMLGTLILLIIWHPIVWEPNRDPNLDNRQFHTHTDIYIYIYMYMYMYFFLYTRTYYKRTEYLYMIYFTACSTPTVSSLEANFWLALLEDPEAVWALSSASCRVFGCKGFKVGCGV